MTRFESKLMRMFKVQPLSVFLLVSTSFLAHSQPGSQANDLIRIHSPIVALEHVKVIDGTGADPRPDQTILISGTQIAAIADSASAQIPPTAKRVDFSGYSAIPGLVGMHDHLFYVTAEVNHNFVAHDMPFSFPRLFLANGVTTIRTAGSYEPYTDLEIKRAVDQDKMLGPKINLTGPYLVEGALGQIQLHALNGPEDARRTVNYWADEGMTSFKAYEYISLAELQAGIDDAHKRGLTFAGHLCSIGFTEAAALGIDSLEHGLFVDTEFDPKKKPEVCPKEDWPTIVPLEIDSPQIQTMIATLVKHHVAVTSTLAIIEHSIYPPRGVSRPALDCLSAEALKGYEQFSQFKTRQAADPRNRPATLHFEEMFRKEMQFELAFTRAGGLLMAGSDAVFNSMIAGFGDQRELELLVEAGFTPVEAIKIATLNGAQFLKQANHIGSLSMGQQADIMIVKGDPSKHIEDIENVEMVFKDGVGYDSKKLIASVKGQVGIR